MGKFTREKKSLMEEMQCQNVQIRKLGRENSSFREQIKTQEE
jgi:hypothetical protein